MGEGSIVLSGFKLDEAEKAIVNNLIQNYKSKIRQKIKFEEIRLRMKKSQHGKVYLHEVQGLMIAGKNFSSKAEDYNLFAAIAEVLEKLAHEASHYQNRRK